MNTSSRFPLSRREFIRGTGLVAATLAVSGSTARAARGPAAPLPPLSSKKLGIALLGLGSYATGQLAPALQRTQNCYLAGAITGDPEGKGKQLAAQYGFPEKNIYSYDTMAAIKDNPDIDIIYVVTPNSLHLANTLAAAKAGKHVSCEKPMALTVAECDQMIAACKAANVQLSIGYRNNFDPYFQEMMRIARWKELGALKTLNGEFTGGNTAGAWRTKMAFAGGGPIMDLGIYVIHASVLAANGESPVAVTAKPGPVTMPDIYKDVEETMEFTLEFANGAKCDGYTSYTRVPKPGGGGTNRFRVDYEKGFLNFPAAFNYNGTNAITAKGPLDFGIARNDGNYQQARQMDDFARCVRDKVPTSVPGEMGRQDMRIIEAIYASAKVGGKRTLVKMA